MVEFIVAALVVVVLGIYARWVRDRCGELDRNLFGPTNAAPPGSPS